MIPLRPLRPLRLKTMLHANVKAVNTMLQETLSAIKYAIVSLSKGMRSFVAPEE